MKSALKDVKVIEYGNFISIPHCGKLFADLGAEVIKVEAPGFGDIARRRGPFLKDIPGTERSGLFLALNTNKLGVTLDIEKATGREIFKKLIKDADILLEDNEPGKLDSLGLGYNDLKPINSALIVTSITPFGQTGPYKNYKGSDLIGWEMGGAGFITPRMAGTTKQEPLRVMQMASFITGATAAVATMCALHVQRTSHKGQHVDVSQMEAIIQLNTPANAYWIYEHEIVTRASKATGAPRHIVKCRDGWVLIYADEPHHWQRLVSMMGNPDWGGEEQFKDMWSRARNWEILQPLIETWTIQHTKKEIFNAGREAKIPIAMVNSIADIVASEHLKERGFFTSVKHPETGELTYPGAPYKFSGTPWAIRKPAPLLGQHNEEIYCNRLGYTKKELTSMYKAGIV